MDQGDQIGRIIAHWATAHFGHCFLIAKAAKIFAHN
jgi:hypothetical protein